MTQTTEIHNPSRLKLPPLSLNKNEKRLKLEQDTFVKSLLDSKLLLTKDLNQLLSNLLGLSKQIENKLKELKKVDSFFLDKVSDKLLSSKKKYNMFSSLSLSKLKELSSISDKKALMKKLKEEAKKLVIANLKEKNKETTIEIKDLSDQVQKTLDNFERKTKVDINILETINYYTCKNCGIFAYEGRFHNSTCYCGVKIEEPSKCSLISISKLSQSVISFFGNKSGLEYGIDYLFKKKNFSTKCGIHILGHSGNFHEIDNLAELSRKHLRVLCECKTSDIIINDVMIFSGKMGDIGCTRGYMFTTSFGVSEEVKQLARVNNITVVEQVLEKDEDDILEEITDC
jgi:phosphoribosyl-ATP pyrophosphohydrolase